MPIMNFITQVVVELRHKINVKRTLAEVGEALGRHPVGNQAPLFALENFALQPGLDAARHWCGTGFGRCAAAAAATGRCGQGRREQGRRWRRQRRLSGRGCRGRGRRLLGRDVLLLVAHIFIVAILCGREQCKKDRVRQQTRFNFPASLRRSISRLEASILRFECACKQVSKNKIHAPCIAPP